MNYEQLLDEIMVNTLSAKELIGTPQRDFQYAVCPWDLEFHTMIFLSSILLTFDQKKPIIALIQVAKLPEPVMLYTGEIGPHFGRLRNVDNQPSQLFAQHGLAQTEENFYPYLDKLFCYLGVINPNQEHLVIFIRQGVKQTGLLALLKELLGKDYSLLVVSNCYDGLPMQACKAQSETLVAHLLDKQMSEAEQEAFPAFTILNQLLPKELGESAVGQLVNTEELGFSQDSSTSFWFMLG